MKHALSLVGIIDLGSLIVWTFEYFFFVHPTNASHASVTSSHDKEITTV